MGVDLTIVPERYVSTNKQTGLAYSRLAFNGRYYEFFDALRKKSVVLEEGIMWYDDDGLVKVFVDPYEEKLTWLYAADFLRVWAGQTGTLDAGVWDKAIIKFVEALPYDNRIILWFH